MDLRTIGHKTLKIQITYVKINKITYYTAAEMARAGFLNLGIIDILGHITLYSEGRAGLSSTS